MSTRTRAEVELYPEIYIGQEHPDQEHPEQKTPEYDYEIWARDQHIEALTQKISELQAQNAKARNLLSLALRELERQFDK